MQSRQEFTANVHIWLCPRIGKKVNTLSFLLQTYVADSDLSRLVKRKTSEVNLQDNWVQEQRTVLGNSRVLPDVLTVGLQ